jgi:hypothetical protein
MKAPGFRFTELPGKSDRESSYEIEFAGSCMRRRFTWKFAELCSFG